MGFYILLGVVTVLFLALLELNKNMIVGWLLAVVLLCGYGAVRQLVLRSRGFGLRALAFIGLLALLAGVLVWTVGPVKRYPAAEGKTAVTEIVTLSSGGQLTGLTTEDGAVEVFAGIPYAAPPVGELRWRPPQDPQPWQGVLAADKFAPMAMQPQNHPVYNSLARIIGYHDYEITTKDNFRDPVSEDALYLNIWRPVGSGEKLPVLVYIHGGSLQTGQPWYADYSGEGLARKGVIVVNMGYRLGVFGFLASEEALAQDGTTGNYGLMDQIKALEWVQENIAAFGGDPDNVTLAGESAGSACVTALCTSPMAKGLFRRAIGESSTVTAPQPTHSFRSLDEALATGKETLERFGASTLEELRQVDAAKLVAAADTNHHITVDGAVLPMTPYEAYRLGIHNEEAILQGFNSAESAPFILFDQAKLSTYESKVRAYFGSYADEVLSLYPVSNDAEARQNWADIYSAVFFTYGHYCWTRQANALGMPAYEYYFTKTNGRLGPWHSGEEVYCYGNVPADSRLYDDRDLALSDVFSSYFANFAATGDPNGAELPRWELSRTAAEVMTLDAAQEMGEDPYLPIYDVLDRFYGWEPMPQTVDTQLH